MKVLITGAKGMLGQDLVAAADAVHHEVVAVGHDELDVTNERAVTRFFEAELPAVVVNAAAYTNVDLAESDPELAHAVNGEGAEIVASAASEIGAKVIFPSTDYVFDGTKGEPYDEHDEPNPLSVYGASKLAGEIATAQSNPRHLILRTAWLFGHGGRNFVETMLGIAEKQNEVLVVRDQIGCPTYTRHLAEAIVELIDYETLGTMHMAGGEYCSWYDFAREIFRQSRVDCNVLSGTSDMLDRPAPRPSFSALVSARSDAIQLPRWDHGLHGYLLARADGSESIADEIGFEEKPV
jgi:dTDP-4-dehydrorhamnose reductase